MKEGVSENFVQKHTNSCKKKWEEGYDEMHKKRGGGANCQWNLRKTGQGSANQEKRGGRGPNFGGGGVSPVLFFNGIALNGFCL